MFNLYITVGTTSSGKSIYTKKWKEEHKDGMVLDADLFRMALYNGYDYREDREYMISGFLSASASDFLRDRDVLVDDASLFLTKAARKEFLSHVFMRFFGIPESSVKVHFLVFPQITEEQCRERRKDDTKGFSLDQWAEILKKHNEILEIPTEDEGIIITVQ
jgi:hypothetical protein